MMVVVEHVKYHYVLVEKTEKIIFKKIEVGARAPESRELEDVELRSNPSENSGSHATK